MTTELFKRWAEFWPEKQLKAEAISMNDKFLLQMCYTLSFDKNFLYF